MDAQPLMIVKPEDLHDWLNAVLLLVACVSAAAVWLAALSVGLWHAAWRWYRQRGAAKPFAQRAAALEAARLKTFLLLDRIATRNARERTYQRMLP